MGFGTRWPLSMERQKFDGWRWRRWQLGDSWQLTPMLQYSVKRLMRSGRCLLFSLQQEKKTPNQTTSRPQHKQFFYFYFALRPLGFLFSPTYLWETQLQRRQSIFQPGHQQFDNKNFHLDDLGHLSIDIKGGRNLTFPVQLVICGQRHERQGWDGGWELTRSRESQQPPPQSWPETPKIPFCSLVFDVR